MSRHDDSKDISFATIIREALTDYGEKPAPRWRLDCKAGSPWNLVTCTDPASNLSEQGWKLHVSATIASAEQVLRLSLPVLVAENASFKAARSIAELHALNEGRSGISQIGKFITVYPNDDAQAVRLAAALDEALQGIPHPDVPSDLRLKPDSAVYYRFGSFGDRHIQTSTGQVFSAVAAPDGSLVPDKRSVPYRAPDWAVDPFRASGAAVDPPKCGSLLRERYLVLHTLDVSARGSVHLGADMVEGRRCLIKRAARDAQTSEDGRHDARDRLRHEAEVLSRLSNTLPVPAVFDLIENQGDLFLVMEDLEGETLSEYIERRASFGPLLSTAEAVGIGRELASLLGLIHSRGMVYRDLKSSNVIMTTDGGLRLVDFELTCDLSAPGVPEGRGTDGYMSPQACSGEQPTVLDDIHSLGAVLYFIATAAEPSLGPPDRELMCRPIRLLNPRIDSRFEALVGRCLAEDAALRFQSMAALGAALDSCLTLASAADTTLTPSSDSEWERAASEVPNALARRLGDSLSKVSSRDPEGGVFWSSNYNSEGMLDRRDLSGGTAGVLLALAELVSEFENPVHLDALSQGAEWLAKSKPCAMPLPGLYIGESGVAAALLRAGQVLHCGKLVEMAAERSRFIAALPHQTPDLYHGSAGRLRFHLFLWKQTNEPEHLNHAIAAGEAVIGFGENTTDGGMRWTLPPGYEGLSGETYLGYAHGAAGIGDSLLDLYLASGEERFLSAAQSAARWLSGRSIEVFGKGLDWTTTDSAGELPAGAFWCHGAGGIGRFFLNLAKSGVFPGARSIAEGAAHTVSMTGRRIGPTQCHGLAGNIEFVLDMFQDTGNRSFLSQARTMARILEAFALDRDGLFVWASDSSRVIATDYMTGYAGVTVCLLRLARPEERPHQLSVQGFGWRPQARGEPDAASFQAAAVRERRSGNTLANF